MHPAKTDFVCLTNIFVNKCLTQNTFYSLFSPFLKKIILKLFFHKLYFDPLPGFHFPLYILHTLTPLRVQYNLFYQRGQKSIQKLRMKDKQVRLADALLPDKQCIDEAKPLIAKEFIWFMFIFYFLLVSESSSKKRLRVGLKRRSERRDYILQVNWPKTAGKTKPLCNPIQDHRDQG